MPRLASLICTGSRTTCMLLSLFWLWLCTQTMAASASAMISPGDSHSHSMDTDMDLVMVQVVFRHGDRSPTAAYPADPYQEKDWPRGFGQLSKKGMLQHYELGQYFKDRYIAGHPYSLLSEDYDVNEIYIRSTDVDRTLMSAYSNLAGLYPPTTEEDWNPKIPSWQPLPVHTVLGTRDHLLDTDAPCPKSEKLFNDTMKSPNVVAEEILNEEFYRFVANETGYDHEGIQVIWKVYDTIFCEKQNNMTQLPWVDGEWKDTGLSVYDKLKQQNYLDYELKFNTTEQRRLRGGSLLKEMISNMEGKMAGQQDKKFFMYSAHDTTVAAFTSALQISNGIQPPYATAAIIELFNSSDGYVIKALYRNDSSTDPYTRTVPGCGEPCYFSKFVEILADVIPDDIATECQLTSEGAVTLSRDEIIMVALGVMLLIVVVVSVILVILHKRSRSQYGRYTGLSVAT